MLKKSNATPNVPGLLFQLKEEQYLRSLLLNEMDQHRNLWRLLRLWEKTKRYLRRPEALLFKLAYYGHKLIGSDAFETRQFPDTFSSAYARKTLEYACYHLASHNKKENIDQIEAIINQKQYKGIIVYPSTIHWEPLQRPQQILREFAKLGYLCFFCEPSQSKMRINQISDNLYSVSGEKYLIYPLQKHKVIVLCTWMLNLPFINQLPNRILWYDLIDKLEIFSLYDEEMQKMHNEIALAADIVTYSGLKLKDYLAERDKLFYVPNGVTIEDFEREMSPASNAPSLNLLKDLKESGKPLIGFYGSIAEWVDLELIKTSAKYRKDWEFILIGHAWVDLGEIQKLPNVHCLGLMPYDRLPILASQFDVAIIPFKISLLTDCVSPIKFFEYAALGLPVVTTPFFEIQQYQGEPFIRLARSAEEFMSEIEYFLRAKSPELSREARMFARGHQWRDHLKPVLENIQIG